MKTAKVLLCIALSFSVLFVGIGFAAVSKTLSFSGSLDFQHTGLYISNITAGDGVTVQGYSGTLINLTATKDSTMTVTVANPTEDVYYYLNYTAGDHTLDLKDTITLGSAVNPYRTITFTVTFSDEIDHAHAVKFNFTLIPPYIPPEEPDEPDPTDPTDPSDPSNPESTDPTEPQPTDPVTPPGGGTTNATAVIEFVLNHFERGLNKEDNKHTFEQWVSESNQVRYCRENNVPGGNLSNEFEDLGAQDVLFTLEWVSSTKYNLYLYYAIDATRGNEQNGAYITTYKQELIYNSIDGLWLAGDSYKGYAKVQSEKNGYGIETATDQSRNEYVVWYSSENDLPDGALVA